MGGSLLKLAPVFVLLVLSGLAFLFWNITDLEKWNCQTVSTFYQIQSNMQSAFRTAEPSPPPDLNHTYCNHVGQEPTPKEAWEESQLLKSVAWPQPLVPGLPLRQSSDPAQSYYVIQGSDGWRVGGQLEVVVRMNNYLGQPKKHGGDFLIGRLHTPELKAGVAGTVRDHGDGNYTVLFPLLWEGVVQVGVTLVHPSEAVVVLRRLREERPDRVYFKSLFRSQYISQTTICNLCLPPTQEPICNYTDPHTGEPWFCYKPRVLDCDARVTHSKGGYKNKLLTKEEALFFQSNVNIKIPIHASGTDNVTVLPAERAKVARGSLSVTPAGYYYEGSWRPLTGVVMRRFNDVAAITQCLTGKVVYIFGDSTARQWFEYLNKFFPAIDLRSPKGTGPSLAVESKNNIMIQYRCHGPPIRFTGVSTQTLTYVFNELDRLPGGPHTVVALSIWSHFSTFPMEVYIRRLRHIRKAVIRLLNRAPSTLIFIRTANLQRLDPESSLYNSDWFSIQLDTVLRAMFKGLNVHVVDAWEMTLAHEHPHILHPPPEIIQNMMDLMLSHICPVKKKGG
ncbi:NXPE family member 3 [Chanos chanos]|uniref:NXPE family member 3 n=1 Tax=Chanos chanos TaxID=29144 RepID=A0A6J2WD58_CHACN|nr:NXPE family member 3 [Chanos chanos]